MGFWAAWDWASATLCPWPHSLSGSQIVARIRETTGSYSGALTIIGWVICWFQTCCLLPSEANACKRACAGKAKSDPADIKTSGYYSMGNQRRTRSSGHSQRQGYDHRRFSRSRARSASLKNCAANDNLPAFLLSPAERQKRRRKSPALRNVVTDATFEGYLQPTTLLPWC